MLTWVRRMFCRSGEEMVAEFRAGRSPQTDQDFLAASALPPDPETIRVALAVRRTVARIGSIEPVYIQPGDVYPDQLALLPLWDSMDWMAFFMELEEQLDTRLSVEEMDRCFSPFRVSVREMVVGVRRVLAGRAGEGG